MKRLRITENQFKTLKSKLTEMDNYPPGARLDPSAPWNRDDDEVTGIRKTKDSGISLIEHDNGEYLFGCPNNCYIYTITDAFDDIKEFLFNQELIEVPIDYNGEVWPDWKDYINESDIITGLSLYFNDFYANNTNRIQSFGVDEFLLGSEFLYIDSETSNEELDGIIVSPKIRSSIQF